MSPLSIPRQVASKAIFDQRGLRLLEETLSDGVREWPHYVLEGRTRSAATLAQQDDGQLVLIRQYRHPVGQIIYELPGGRLGRTEDSLEGAKREFEEETGLILQEIRFLTRYNQFPGTLRIDMALYFATGLTPGVQKLDEGEFLEVVTMPLGEVLELIRSDACIDGSLMLGVLMAQHKGWLKP